MTSQQRPNSNLVLYIILGSIGLLTPFAIDMYLPAMPDIAKDLGVDGSSVQATLTAYTAGFAFGQLLYGPMSDSFGRRPIMLWGNLFFIITSIVCAMSNDVDMLILMRVTQGLAGAASAVVVQAVVRDLFNREDFARAMSFITLVITISPLLAPMIGEHLSDWFGWRSLFYALAGLAIVVTLSVYMVIPETLSPENKKPLRFRSTLKNYFQLLANPISLGLNMCGAMSFSGMFAFIAAGAFVYIDYFGTSSETFSYLFGANVIGMIIMSTINGKYVRRMGSHKMLRIGLCLQMFATLCLVSCWLLNLPLWCVVLSMIFFMGSVPVIGSNSMALLLSSYPAMAGTASSLAGTLRFGIGALITGVIAILPETLWPMAITMAICALLANVWYWTLGRKAS